MKGIQMKSTRGHFRWSGKCLFGEGNGSPLQYYYLEYHMGWGEWWSIGLQRVGYD